MSQGRKEPMKVVFINTEYVETDAGSFKSIVQKLTGKDAIVSGGSPSSKQGRGDGSNWPSAILDRSWSIREFDQLMKEMPTVDELCQKWY